MIMDKELGAVYTPPEVADLLANWAIQSPDDLVLDLGIGEGVFVFTTCRRLVSLGASPAQAVSQIYGTEVNEVTFKKFTELTSQLGLDFPELTCQDFFQASFPQVDAVIGNPPYIRRSGFSAERLREIRNKVIETNPEIRGEDLSQLTDVYVYFLLQAIKSLKPEGRLAVIVADSWLNVRYGRFLKNYLKTHFDIERIINFDRPLFENAQVKPILIFATKKTYPPISTQVAFTRVMNGLPISSLSQLFQSPEPNLDDINTKLVPSEELNDAEPWGVHFKISEIDMILTQNDWFVPLQEIAHTRIGIQTLAKNFFALTPEQIQDTGVEPQFLEPFAHSVAQFEHQVIDENIPPSLYVFYCSQPKDELNGTQALVHIQSGEQEMVKVRGKDEVVIGYHNKERIIKENRPHWYDIKSTVERRGRASILIPRLISHRYIALWNKAGYVPGGVTIELIPHVSLQSKEEDILLYLALLNSTLMEVVFRGYAQMYGGGASTVGLAQTKLLPVPDITRFTTDQQNTLISAYHAFLGNGERESIDDAIWDILDLNGDIFYSAVEDLVMLALTAKKKID